MKLTFNIVTLVALLPWPLVFMTSPMMFANPGPGKSPAFMVMAVLCYPIYISFIYWIFGFEFFSFSGKKFFLWSTIGVLGASMLFGYPIMIVKNLMGYGIQGFHVRNGDGVYYNGEIVEGMDPATTRIQFPGNEKLHYATDKDHAYFQGKRIPGSHGPSFERLKHPQKRDSGEDRFSFYFRDQNQVYFHSQPLEGANPEKFAASDWGHGSDGKNYYFREVRLETTGESITELGQDYFHDGHSIFYQHKKLEIKPDFNSFKFVGEKSEFATDKNSVFYLSSDTAFKLDVDRESFVSLGEQSIIKDKSAVFKIIHDEKKLQRLPVDDPASFEFVAGTIFTRDKNNLYLTLWGQFKKIDGPDPQNIKKVPGTEKYLAFPYYTDGKKIYHFNRVDGEYDGTYTIVEGADLESFKMRPLDYRLGYESDAFDKNHSYHEGKKVK